MTRARLCFLDIDGVLRTWPQSVPFYTRSDGTEVMSYNPACAAHLNVLLGLRSAALVVTSNHREQGRVKMTQQLRAWGIQAPIHSMLAPNTLWAWEAQWPRLAFLGLETALNDRALQILLWTVQYRLRHAACTDVRAVILDDDNVPALLPGMLALRTTLAEGLTWPLTQQALAFLRD